MSSLFLEKNKNKTEKNKTRDTSAQHCSSFRLKC